MTLLQKHKTLTQRRQDVKKIKVLGNHQIKGEQNLLPRRHGDTEAFSCASVVRKMFGLFLTHTSQSILGKNQGIDLLQKSTKCHATGGVLAAGNGDESNLTPSPTLPHFKSGNGGGSLSTPILRCASGAQTAARHLRCEQTAMTDYPSKGDLTASPPRWRT